MPKVLDLPFREDISKPNRDNAIDVYIGDTPEDVIGDDVWAETFTVQPAPLTAEEKKAWLSKVTVMHSSPLGTTLSAPAAAV